MKMTHELKTDADGFDAVERGEKTLEIRFNDRRYEVGDTLKLLRTVHAGEEMKAGKPLIYSDVLPIKVKVTHILRGPIYGLAEGWVIMSVRKE